MCSAIRSRCLAGGRRFTWPPRRSSRPIRRASGAVCGLVTKGWLPYTLRWEFVVTRSHYPFGFTIDASGDFVGRGEWTFVQEGPTVRITLRLAH